MSESDFSLAQQFAGFARWKDFDDFQFERDCLALGYDAAGATAARRRVAFPAFAGWSRLTGAPIDVDGLDEFAAHARFRAVHAQARVRGIFGQPGQPLRHAVAIAGAQVVVVREDVYARWRADFAARAPFPAPGLNLYARQIVACVFGPSTGLRRPAFKNA